MVRRDGETAGLRRIVVAGAGGFFGGHVAALLRAEGVDPVAHRRSMLDVEDPRSIRAAVRPRDVIVDAAGPYQDRTTALVEIALEAGADVVDLNEDLTYAKGIAALDARAREHGVAIVSSCSAVSSVAAALVELSGVDRPTRVSALVAPASRVTARAGTVRALLASVGRPIEVLRGGRLSRAIGWRETRPFALPRRRGHLIESALALTLPVAYPTLRSIDTWTDAGMPGANALLSLVARAGVARLAEGAIPVGIFAARVFGTRRGAFAVEVEGDSRVVALSFGSARRSWLIACAPAVLAARSLAADSFDERGVVRADRHVRPGELLAYLGRLGIVLERSVLELDA